MVHGRVKIRDRWHAELADRSAQAEYLGHNGAT